ncbi:Uncharacterised protein [Vibrio cholerae]|nr:Uncharacterised protein [Vibrio cholerae]CSC01650.1 Uncharacterised protein [Vibrio cholerae]
MLLGKIQILWRECFRFQPSVHITFESENRLSCVIESEGFTPLRKSSHIESGNFIADTHQLRNIL